ncbi:MAG: radical SAM protein [Cyanobacteria bacterium SIG28]|nr:radical SAM protein [Cyanobacteria bacterium SIG28]
MNYSEIFDKARDFYTSLSYNDKYGKAKIPFRYFLELTYRCNLQCPYCYVGKERDKQELSLQEWKNVIDQIPFYGIVTLVGGEPLIRKDFIDIFAYTSKKVWNKTHVVSNGILINDEIIKAFIKYKLLLLSVSLDGYGENHNKNRGKEGIFDKIISNLENLKAQKPRQMVDIKTIVLENNLDDLPKLYKLCDKMGFEFLSISFLRNNSWKQNSVLQESFIPEFNENYPIKQYFDMEHFKEVYKEISSFKSKTKLRFSPKFEYLDSPLDGIEKFFQHDENTLTTDIYYPCTYPYNNMMINPEGFVYPCLSMKIGNVKDKSLKDLFNNPKYCCFRKNLKANGGTFGACQLCCECKILEK